MYIAGSTGECQETIFYSTVEYFQKTVSDWDKYLDNQIFFDQKKYSKKVKLGKTEINIENMLKTCCYVCVQFPLSLIRWTICHWSSGLGQGPHIWKSINVKLTSMNKLVWMLMYSKGSHDKNLWRRTLISLFEIHLGFFKELHERPVEGKHVQSVKSTDNVYIVHFM